MPRDSRTFAPVSRTPTITPSTSARRSQSGANEGRRSRRDADEPENESISDELRCEHRPPAEEREHDRIAHEADALHADRRERDTDATRGHRGGVVTEAEREGRADAVEESFYWLLLIAGGEPPATPLRPLVVVAHA